MGELNTLVQEKAHLWVAEGVLYSGSRESPLTGGIRKPTFGWQKEFYTLIQEEAHLRVAGVLYSDTRESPLTGGIRKPTSGCDVTRMFDPDESVDSWSNIAHVG